MCTHTHTHSLSLSPERPLLEFVPSLSQYGNIIIPPGSPSVQYVRQKSHHTKLFLCALIKNLLIVQLVDLWRWKVDAPSLQSPLDNVTGRPTSVVILCTACVLLACREELDCWETLHLVGAERKGGKRENIDSGIQASICGLFLPITTIACLGDNHAHNTLVPPLVTTLTNVFHEERNLYLVSAGHDGVCGGIQCPKFHLPLQFSGSCSPVRSKVLTVTTPERERERGCNDIHVGRRVGNLLHNTVANNHSQDHEHIDPFLSCLASKCRIG